MLFTGLVALHLLALHLLGRLCAVEAVNDDLHILVLSPYPSEGFADQVAWPGGPALFPAAQLAADMVNNRTDILPDHTLRLINGDSGCALTTRATVTFVREATFHYLNQIIGIVGPACTPAAMEIGGITTDPYADLVSITIANGPLLRTTNFSNMFRLFSSARLSAHALFKLMEKTGWKLVAAVVDISHWFFLQIYSSFREIINATDYIAHPLDLQNGIFPFSSIHNKFNVIFVFAGTRDSAKILCLSLKLNFIYPDYQWVLSEVEVSDILVDVKMNYNGKYYTCTPKEMMEAVNQVIVLNFRLIPENKTILTDSGLSYDDFLAIYENYFQKHLYEENIPKEDVRVSAKEWAASYFDSVWALSLALNRSARVLKNGNTTRQYCYSNTTAIIRNELLAVNFSGLSGNIRFHNKTLEVPSVIDIYQMNSVYNIAKIGYYYEEKVFITDPGNASFVDPIKMELRVVNSEAVAVFFPAAILILLIIGGLHLIHFEFRQYKSIRAQSPHFSHLTFSGCYLYIMSALLDTVRAANWTRFNDTDSSQLIISIGALCNIIFWCLTLGTSLIFGTMCVLSWRIYRIFTHFLNPGKLISDPFLVGIVVALLTINVTVLVAWSTYDPLLPRFITADEGLRSGIIPVYAKCDCKYFSNWLLVWILHELIILVVLILAILNRHVPRKDYFNNTRSHGVMVYIMSFLNGICVPIYFILLQGDRINTSYVFFQLFTLGSTLSVCIFLFVPPVIPLLRKAKLNFQDKITHLNYFSPFSLTPCWNC